MTHRTEPSRDGTYRIIGLALVVLLFCIFSPAFARLYTEIAWFRSLDLTQIWLTRFGAGAMLAGVAMVVSIAFLLLNWSLIPQWIAPMARLVTQVSFTPRTVQGNGRGNQPQRQQVEIPTRPFKLLFTLGAILAGAILGFSFNTLWRTYLVAREAVPFGLADPIFGRDASFYVFQLPWYSALLGRLQILIALAFLGVLARFAVFGQIRSRGVTAHLSLLGSAWLALMGVERLLGRLALLQTNGGVVFGAGYADIHARLPIYTIQAVLFFAAAATLIVNLFVRQWKLLVGIGLFWLGLTIVAPLYPSFVQQFKVEPNEFILERPYIEHNITFTRYAYGLDRIAEQDFSGAGVLTAQDLEASADVLNNVRLWDYRPLLRTFGQLQEIRLYYSFDDVDVDRYQINSGLTQVMLAARELDVDELADQAQTWVNRHLLFTHGYGMALSSVNAVTAEGLPDLLVRDLPPVSEDPVLQIDRPGIYFGEKTREYALVNASEDEFDYPQGDANVYARYSGPDGVRLGGVIQRALLATRFGSTQLLVSSALSSESRILFHRTIQDRAATIAPMLMYDSDPYPVIDDGKLVWLMDAYTWSDHFPYSQPMGGLNYMRNSVKVTIDAYTGTIHFYLIDPTDPVAATYAKIFPGLFEPADAMPASLRAHWRYPETLFLTQSELYATYHMRDPQVFYNREDLWDVPQELVETSQQAMEPYYVTMRLPGSDDLEFMLIRPYVPSQKQNMVAWLFARCDGEHYGELGVFKLSKDRLIYGPLQIEGRIDQEPSISQQLSLWNQRGSRVLRGNLLVIPLNDAFLYVEPLYLEAESGQLPQLVRVIAAYRDGVVMGPTLADALLQLFGESSTGGTAPPPEGTALGELATEAWNHYQAAQACLTAGDWTCYGAEQQQLEQILKQMVGEQ